MTLEKARPSGQLAVILKRTAKLMAELSDANRPALELELERRRGRCAPGTNLVWMEAWSRADRAVKGRDFRELTAADWVRVVGALRETCAESTLYTYTNYLKASINQVLATGQQETISEALLAADPQKALVLLLRRLNRTENLTAIREALTVAEPERRPQGRVLSPQDFRLALEWIKKETDQGAWDAEAGLELTSLTWQYRDAGWRARECLSLRSGDWRVDMGRLAEVTLPESAPFLKTGYREVWVSDCVAPTEVWRTLHPAEGNPRAPLYPGIRSRDGLAPMNYQFLSGFFQRMGAESGINEGSSRDKPLTAHDFRHTRATECARANWHPVKMERQFGWQPGSRMVGWYSHIVNGDVRDQVMRDHGLDSLGYMQAMDAGDDEAALAAILERIQAKRRGALVTMQRPKDWQMP
jgi:integrase